MATAREQVRGLRRETEEASRALSRLGGVVPGTGAGGGGFSTGDFRRMRGDIQSLSREVRRIGAGRPDPFLNDLIKSGPRRA